LQKKYHIWINTGIKLCAFNVIHNDDNDDKAGGFVMALFA